jgi:Pyruvate phosphate dikinase, AMP/ATP-binding domain
MANILKTIPGQSLEYHARRNDFSRWLMARFEMEIAQRIRKVMLEDFSGVEEARQYLITVIRNKLKKRQLGRVTDFVHDEFDPDTDFVKIGKGSLGGKARGLAFISHLLSDKGENAVQFEDIQFSLPKTMVITTEGFDLFAEQNNIFETLTHFSGDAEIERIFHRTSFPERLRQDLHLFLEHTHYPLAVRSSAILEDAHYRASAGAYNTYMLPNNDGNIEVRLEQLIEAIKLIYSSIFQESSRILAKHSVYHQEDDKMAVIVQQLVGTQQHGFFYPAISGVAQSYNFYPVSYMKADEGVAHIALGLGKTVVDGGVALRFSPKYPRFLPQFSNVDDILKNCQRHFYALDMRNPAEMNLANLLKRIEIDEATDHFPVRKLASTYIVEDARLRDFYSGKGYPVITFANILKYDEIPLGEILTELLAIGERGMGCAVEIEFAVNLAEGKKPHFHLLQIRPMAVAQSRTNVTLSAHDRQTCWCFSNMAMGQSQIKPVADIIYVKPESFDTAKTREIAEEINSLNNLLREKAKKYLLIGPGRWGSTDRWLGIPVKWNAITEAHTIVETTSEKLHAEPSQGSHFFHNITSLGINYLVVPPKDESFISMEWLEQQPVVQETEFLKYVEPAPPALLKIDGTSSAGLLLPSREE